MPYVDPFEKASADSYVDPFDVSSEVGAGEAGKRGLKQGFGAVNQWAGNMAMLPIIGTEMLANLFRGKPDFSLSDWGMRKFVTPFETMQQENVIRQGEHLSPAAMASNVAGNLLGQAPAFILPMGPANQAPRLVQQSLPVAEQIAATIGREMAQAQPLAQSAMVQRSNQLQAEGVPADVANNAALAGYGTNAVGYAAPISAAGNVLKRMATGAGANIILDAPAVMQENSVLQAAGYGQAAQDPFSAEQMASTGGLGALFAALLGQRAPASIPTPEGMAANRAFYNADQAKAAEAAARPYTEEVGAAYRAAGEDPDSVARAFERARLFGTPDPNPDITTRTVKGDLTPEQVQTIKDYTGATDEEIATMSVSGQRKLLMRAMGAKDRDAERGALSTSYGEDMLSSPASRPDVPGDRMAMPGELDESGRRITGDAREAGIGADVKPETARKAAAAKQKMLDQLDAMRQQLDKLDDNETRSDLKRKADMGLGMTDNERKAHAAFTKQREKLAKSVFDLEGRIYDVEARSEQGSRMSTGTSDRPFRMDDVAPDSFEAAARPEAEARARAKADEDLRAQLDALEAEWRERQRMRQQERQQRQAGERFQEEDTGQTRYAGKNGSTTEAPMEGGKFKADEYGYVMSDTGSPMQFKHQRDAGWWILRRGNKGGTGQVFEIANHPSGKGFTVRVTMDNGAGNARHTGTGDADIAGGRNIGGGDLTVRGAGNRGTVPEGRRESGGGAVAVRGADAAGSAPNAKQGDAALAPPEVVAEVRRMAENTGLAQEPGRMVRGSEDSDNHGYHDISRTKAIPRESWWLERPSVDTVGKRGKQGRRFIHSEADTKKAVQAWIEGRPLTDKQRSIVDFMRGVAEQRLNEEAELRAARDAEAAEKSREAQAEREALQAADEIMNDPDFGLGGRVLSMDDADALFGYKETDHDMAGQTEAARPAGAAADAANPQGSRAEAPRAGGEQPDFVLERPTPDDIRARDERLDAERRSREQPVSDADEFVLTGSNRPADEAEARGQQSLLDEPQRPPRAFVNRVEVDANVYDEATGRFVREKVNARQALDAVDSDISLLRRMLDCLGG